ncbi:MAG: type II toxin-antitoxin system RelE/ParE family toxin [Calditrichia bacterium]|nr:type II toxin-antitoxin system RelE/ParE family toxin [Calditrichia bacterium]
MRIIETPIFTKRVQEILTIEEYRLFQIKIIGDPKAGKIIQGSGGIRKIRWSASGRGKRGGSRILYYWYNEQNLLLMLFIFKKNEKDDLTTDQIKILKSIVESEYK